MLDAVESRGGTVLQLGGDAIIAAFGVPASARSAPGAAVEAALEMDELMAPFEAERPRPAGARLGLGIGIASGEVVAGPPPRRDAPPSSASARRSSAPRARSAGRRSGAFG